MSCNSCNGCECSECTKIVVRETGLRGPRGPEGPQGETGAQGETGIAGTSFLQGSGVPASSLGNDGDSYLDIPTGDLYLKTSGSWAVTVNLGSY